jgi:hypothetical protein
MRASTAFLVGVGTVGLAIAGGLGGGLVIGNMMSPVPLKHATETALIVRPTSPQPMPAASALPYTAATLAFSDPSIDGSAPPAEQRADNSASSPPPPAAVVVPNDQATKPASAAATQPGRDAQQGMPAKQASTPEDAYAKAHDSDLKHAADGRHVGRAQRWANRHRRDRDENPDGDWSYSGNYSDRQYRDNRYDYDQAPRFGLSRGRLFGPDD